MPVQDEIERLTKFYPVLQQLPASMQHAFLERSYPVHAATDAILFDVDTVIQSFLLLTEGSVRVIWPGHERELLLYRLAPGSCCVISICHLLDNTRYRARAVVESAMRGVALPQSLFLSMVEQSPAFGFFILNVFSDRYTQVLELLERVTSMRLDGRLARLLVYRGPVIRTTHLELADELGTVREVVSRILKDFEARGLIKLERGQIEVLDQGLLQQIFQVHASRHRIS
jgi:CRP/FNR family transcriptional regulator